MGNSLMPMVAAIITITAIVHLLRRRRLREKYALLWLVMSVGVVVVAFFPVLLAFAAQALGVRTPSNLLFFVACLVLLVVSVQLSTEVSRLEDETRCLAEEIAIVKLAVEEHCEDPRSGRPRRRDGVAAMLTVRRQAADRSAPVALRSPWTSLTRSAVRPSSAASQRDDEFLAAEGGSVAAVRGRHCTLTNRRHYELGAAARHATARVFTSSAAADPRSRANWSDRGAPSVGTSVLAAEPPRDTASSSNGRAGSPVGPSTPEASDCRHADGGRRMVLPDAGSAGACSRSWPARDRATRRRSAVSG